MKALVGATLGPIDSLLARQAPGSLGRIFVRKPETGEPHARTAWILSYTGVSNEPRVLRQAWSLVRAGWNVVVVGYEGHSARPPEWSFLRLADRPRSQSIPLRGALLLQRQVGRLLYRYGAASPLIAHLGAELYYFGLGNWRQNYREILRISANVPRLKGDLVIAHDFHTCPPAAALARQWGAALMVDCHEYGRAQYMDNPEWVKDGRLFATAIQDAYLAQADAVTTVCDGIRDLLNAEQKLKRPVVTVRSTPLAKPQSFRPTGELATVLYHGILSADRGLEEVVASLRYWRPHFQLVLRGSGEEDVIARLRTIAADTGVTERLSIEPPVPFEEIVPAANTADIGYFVQHDFSAQKRFTLPNKFFEYIMAGIALCVGDLPEMSRLVHSYRLGRLVERCAPEAIAETINALTREDIDAYKRASIAAAAELNWQVEQNVFLDLVAQIVPSRATAAS
mgnify:CR=1 FL=1